MSETRRSRVWFAIFFAIFVVGSESAVVAVKKDPAKNSEEVIVPAGHANINVSTVKGSANSNKSYNLEIKTQVEFPKTKNLKEIQHKNVENANKISELASKMLGQKEILSQHVKAYQHLLNIIKSNRIAFHHLRTSTYALKKAFGLMSGAVSTNKKDIKGQGDKFNEQVSEINKTIKSMELALKKHELDILHEQRELDNVTKELKKTNDFISGVAGIVGKLNQTLQDTNKGMNENFKEIRSQTGIISGEIEKMKASDKDEFSKVNGRVGNLENNTDQALKQLSDHSDNIKNIVNNLINIKTSIVSLKEKQDNISAINNENLEKAAAVDNKLSGRIDSLVDKTKEEGISISENSARITELSKPKNCTRGWYYKGGRCYRVVACKKSDPCGWYDAARYCNERAAHIVHVEEQELNDFLIKVKPAPEIKYILIAGTDYLIEGTWQFKSGKVMSYTNWGKGKGNRGQNNNCIRINTNDGTWDDQVCSYRYEENTAFVCQRHPAF